jgi:hypothetical protein
VGDLVRRAGVEAFDQQAGHQPCRAGDIGVGVVGEIGLGEHNHRRRFRLARQSQIAFEPRHVEILIAGGDEEERVDIGGDELNAPPRSSRLALEQTLALKHALDRAAGAVDEQPVADGGMALVVVAKKWRHAPVEVRAGHVKAVPVNGEHPRRQKTRRIGNTQLRLKELGPAIVGQS